MDNVKKPKIQISGLKGKDKRIQLSTNKNLHRILCRISVRKKEQIKQKAKCLGICGQLLILSSYHEHLPKVIKKQLPISLQQLQAQFILFPPSQIIYHRFQSSHIQSFLINKSRNYPFIFIKNYELKPSSHECMAKYQLDLLI